MNTHNFTRFGKASEEYSPGEANYEYS